MTTLAEALKSALEPARGIAGELGLRVHSVTLLAGTWSGTETGDGTETTSDTALLENGQNPKVHWLTDEQLALGNEPVGTIEIGPLTPSHTTGGHSLSTLIGRALTTGQTLYLQVVGPMHPSPGKRYVVSKANAQSALHYTLRAEPG